MSEPTDPIRELSTFRTGGLAVAPLPPEEVRRLGNRRRARHRAAGAFAAAAVIAAVVPIAVLANQNNGSGKPPPVTSTPAAPAKVITYPGNGVVLTDPSEVDKLEGTTSDFKLFIADQVRTVRQDSSCPDAARGVTVRKYSTAGYAIGGINQCGGYVALWVVQDGRWKEAIGTQDEWVCGDLSRFDVPESFAGSCYGPKEVLGPDEDYGLRLGMSMDQVRAAGGTVSAAGNPDYCRTVNPPGVPDQVTPGGTTQVLGYLSVDPDRGVVALFAQKDQVTPRGTRIGDTLEQFRKAYPDATLDGFGGAYYETINATSRYRFDIDRNNTIRDISLVLNGTQGCYE